MGMRRQGCLRNETERENMSEIFILLEAKQGGEDKYQGKLTNVLKTSAKRTFNFCTLRESTLKLKEKGKKPNTFRRHSQDAL